MEIVDSLSEWDKVEEELENTGHKRRSKKSIIRLYRPNSSINVTISLSPIPTRISVRAHGGKKDRHRHKMKTSANASYAMQFHHKEKSHKPQEPKIHKRIADWPWLAHKLPPSIQPERFPNTLGGLPDLTRYENVPTSLSSSSFSSSTSSNLMTDFLFM